MTNQPAQRPECDHHWIHYGQPATGLKWIIQCSQCGDFDAEDLQEQITAAEQRGAEKALADFRRFATRVMPDEVQSKHVIADINIALKRLHNDNHLLMGPLAADLLEGDDA